MNPVAQTRRSPRGNCLQCCLATILEMTLEQVPDFALMRTPEEAFIELQFWLKGHGYAMAEIELTKASKLNPMPNQTVCILKGPHASGERHAIVAVWEDAGFRPVFDPLDPENPDPTEAFKDGLIESLCLLVPLDPCKMWLRREEEETRIIRPHGTN